MVRATGCLALFLGLYINGAAQEAKTTGAGVQLSASAKLEGDKIVLRWTIDYDGPRPPLNILKPMPPDRHMNSTDVHVMVPPGHPGAAVSLSGSFNLPEGRRRPRPAREDFVTVPKGGKAEGTIAVPLRLVKERLIASEAARPDRLPRELYVWLVHGPQARGAEFGLDAWTNGGSPSLRTVTRSVVIEKWP